MFDLRDEDCDVWRQHGSEPGWRAKHKPTGIEICTSWGFIEPAPGEMLASLKQTVTRELLRRHESNESSRRFEAARAVGKAIASLNWPLPKKKRVRYRLMPAGWRPPEIQALIDAAEHDLKAAVAGSDSTQERNDT